MTWCSKIYDMFNGWNEGENEIPTIDSSKVKRINSKFYRHEIEPKQEEEEEDEEDEYQPENCVSLHDSPFSEKSDSLVNEQLYNNDYSTNRDYRREHAYADTLFSSHQYDEQYYHNPAHQPYRMATISNMSLYLPAYMGKTDEQLQQQLSRSFSFDSPMDLQRTHLPTLEDITTPKMRFSLNQQLQRQRYQSNKSNRFSLDQSQVALQNRQEANGLRLSTRSTGSIAECELPSRNNEEIEQEVQYEIKQMLAYTPSGVFPMIFRLQSSSDGYRIEGGYGEPSEWRLQTKIHSEDWQLICENIAAIYTNHFYDQFHYNLYAIDDELNPLVMSVRRDRNQASIILRTKHGSKYNAFETSETHGHDYASLAKKICPTLAVESFENCTNMNAPQLIKAFDEKLETKKFKFGVIYQRKGQTTEEEFFNNETHTPIFDEFLRSIAEKISLKNFKGYRGGLDVSEQTDSPISFYECYEDKEIMFHVSTLLPFTPNDASQIQRKRHIGNDIVAIVFQEENTPFHPSMVQSNFLHVFLVIQPVQILSRPCYKIMLVAREDIEDFPPYLPPNIVYTRTAEQLKPFLLSKLINAEYAAYRCRRFSLLHERTRCSYLKTLCEDLSEKNYESLCEEQKRFQHRRSSILSNSARKRYLSSMKKIFTKSYSTETASPRHSIKSEQVKIKPHKKLIKLGKSMDSVEDYRQYSLPARSDLNVRSSESLQDASDSTLQNHRSLPPAQVSFGDDSDEGLDSMSSAEAPHGPYDSDDPDVYRQQLRDKSQPSQLWHRASRQRHLFNPQAAGIHISEETTV